MLLLLVERNYLQGSSELLLLLGHARDQVTARARWTCRTMEHVACAKYGVGDFKALQL